MPLSLMNRLNKTASAVFKLWMLYFQRILFLQIIDEKHQIHPEMINKHISDKTHTWHIKKKKKKKKKKTFSVILTLTADQAFCEI